MGNSGVQQVTKDSRDRQQKTGDDWRARIFWLKVWCRWSGTAVRHSFFFDCGETPMLSEAGAWLKVCYLATPTCVFVISL